MSLTEMEFPSRVAQKLIRLTRSLYSARSDKLLVGQAEGRLGNRKSCAVVSIRGWRAKGMLNGVAQDRAILRARDYKPLFPRHPLSQIYPSLADTHPPLLVRLVFLCVFNSQLCNQFVALSPSLSSPFLTFSFLLSLFFLFFSHVPPKNSFPCHLSSLYTFILVTPDPAVISFWLLSMLTFFRHDMTLQF